MLSGPFSQMLVLELGEGGIGYDDAQPCSMCSKAAALAGLARVLHTTQQGVARKHFSYHPEYTCEALDLLLS